ncbi:hypothetical protein [Citrobacter amalonaticus]|uniref:hypothetical protein n=1 Tax=Citrobacter amalonaticus TaxID=35703 RepID=UPI0004D63215|nr:hypothetical protein [Citrobacter amalonaticus]KEY51166.1 hypothetical protein DQ02_02515 [Citrobacter amalonaticus]
MSNDVCGYIATELSDELAKKLADFVRKSELGIQKISKRELYNYPSNFIPINGEYCFLIGDAPGYPNATYLIDYYQYDPATADIGFPANPKERLDILIDTLVNMIKITKATKMVVAITDCNQIDNIKKIKFPEMRDVIHADFEKYQAPPDTLYEIIV